MQIELRSTSFSDAPRWLALALVLLLGCAQAVALGHGHTDAAAEAACLACVQLDHTPVLPQGATRAEAPAVLHTALPAPGRRSVALDEPVPYLTRGPPRP